MTRIISSKEYDYRIGDVLENAVVEAIHDVFEDLADDYDIEVPDYDEIEYSGYDSGALPEIRDLCIAIATECGFDLESDGADY